MSTTKSAHQKSLRVALVQFDSAPEKPDANVRKMEHLAQQAVGLGAELVMFHEGTLTDYTPRLARLAEAVPEGRHVRQIERWARRLGAYVTYGLSERDEQRFYITQVFTGPKGFIYRYRKTYLWRQPDDGGYRNEQARYDPGAGPEIFHIAGVRATCFICADGEAPRCIEWARIIKPELVFYPNNRGSLPDFPEFGRRARKIGAPMLVTNRTGQSWIHACVGGCVAYDKRGKVLAAANRDGLEEILRVDLKL